MVTAAWVTAAKAIADSAMAPVTEQVMAIVQGTEVAMDRVTV